ncbi:MAG: N-acetylmuramoyl-L-alanine amidase [Parvibaculales bacterium]
MSYQLSSSPNFDSRKNHAVDMIVLHYTNMVSAAAALARLCDPQAKVSAHYLIDEAGAIFKLVEEEQRAWHAGVAYWQGERDINACSIGIELAHQGPDENGLCAPFPSLQMQALVALLQDIKTRHEIPSARFLGHSDVAPARKIDPGEAFDWQWLAQQGFGLYSTVSPMGKTPLKLCDQGQSVAALRHALADFGYELPASDIYDESTQIVVSAFQRHYRAHHVDGVADDETQSRLLDLLAQSG